MIWDFGSRKWPQEFGRIAAKNGAAAKNCPDLTDGLRSCIYLSIPHSLQCLCCPSEVRMNCDTGKGCFHICRLQNYPTFYPLPLRLHLELINTNLLKLPYSVILSVTPTLKPHIWKLPNLS